jgi:lysophospholipase L1-like esterase
MPFILPVGIVIGSRGSDSGGTSTSIDGAPDQCAAGTGPMTKSSLRRSAGMVAAVVTSALAVGLGGAPALADSRDHYVALGDSYSSGVGTARFDPASGACRRSPLSYPHRWADAHPEDTFADVSCSAADIRNVRDQAAALRPDTDFATLTVGGNDDGFALIMNICVRGNNFLCRIATGAASAYAKVVISRKLNHLYADLRSKAPRAQIVVLSYPHLLAATGTCGSLNISSSKRTSMNKSIDVLDSVIRDRARQNGLQVLDLRTVFSGHEACSARPWIRAYSRADSDEAFHPNAAGHAAIYRAIAKVRAG